jgi:hypothetical protein
VLPTKLLELLRCSWRTRRPTGWLFPGANPSRPEPGQTTETHNALKLKWWRLGTANPASNFQQPFRGGAAGGNILL